MNQNSQYCFEESSILSILNFKNNVLAETPTMVEARDTCVCTHTAVYLVQTEKYCTFR